MTESHHQPALAEGDGPRRHWRQPPAHLTRLSLVEWNTLKRGAGHCRKCGARDELDAFGQWHPPQHEPTCQGSRVFRRDTPAAPLPANHDLKRPRRVFGERDDD